MSRAPTPDPPIVHHQDGAAGGLVLTCEHAGNALPAGFEIGTPRALLDSHRGYDIGALALSQRIHVGFGGTLVHSSYSRLFVDLNRGETERDCIPRAMDGAPIPGNLIDGAAREVRLARYHRPYHAAVDRALTLARRQHARTFLLSIHTYTARLGDAVRELEAGVLFDAHEPLAEQLLEGLTDAGFLARPNEPYCGYGGLIYSARRHGRTQRVPYLELELRNDLLAPDRIDETAPRVLRALEPLLRAVLDTSR